MSHKYVYLFTEGNGKMRELLGGKGANLAEMTNIGLPVPQGFTISTEACTKYYEDGEKINDEIMSQIMEYVDKMEQINGKKFGSLENPLLVSVRSGARASMPGMMDTILNLGLNDDVVEAMIQGNPDPKFARFVWDSYRRFIQMFSDVVMEVGKKYFEQLIDEMKEKKGVQFDVELTADDLKELAGQFKAEYKAKLGVDFPSDPKVQLYEAIRAGAAGSKIMDLKMPTVLERNFKPGFRLDLHIKDLNNSLETGHALGSPMPIASVVMDMMKYMSANGHGAEDHSTLMQYYEQIAGVEIVSEA